MTRVMAGMYAIVAAAFVLVSLYVTGNLTGAEIAAFFGIS